MAYNLRCLGLREHSFRTRCGILRFIVTVSVALSLFTTPLAHNDAFGVDLRLPSRPRGVMDLKEVALPYENRAISIDKPTQTLLLPGEGTEVSLSFTLALEEGLNMSHYSPQIVCSNEETLRSEDVTLGPPVKVGTRYANFTANIVFERAVGVAKVSISFVKPDKRLYATVNAEYILVGMSFFHVNAADGSRTLVSNAGHVVGSYEQLVREPVLVFLCKIQFPDGSSTVSLLSDFAKQASLDSMQIDVEKSPLLASHSFEDCVAGNAQGKDKKSVSLPDGCSLGFSSRIPKVGLLFGVKFQKYRVGTLVINFKWTDLTSSTELEDVCEARLRIVVKGSPPPALISVAPPGPFRKSGGELITCDVINVAPTDMYSFRLGSKPLNQSGTPYVRQGSNCTSMSFVTPPGTGQNIPWELFASAKATGKPQRAVWASLSKPFTFNYASIDNSITSVFPRSGGIDGGIAVTLTGVFAGFHRSNASSDCVFIDHYKLEAQYFISVSATKIIFTLPYRGVTHISRSIVDISVQIRGVRSNKVKFEYLELTKLSMRVMGGSRTQGNDVYHISMCAGSASRQNNFTVLANTGTGSYGTGLLFNWHVVSLPSQKEVYKSSGSDKWALSVPFSALESNLDYSIVLVAADKKRDRSFQASTRIKTTSSHLLGVSLVAERTRSIAYPATDMRIAAAIVVHSECTGGGNLTNVMYEWTYGSLRQTFSSRSVDADLNAASPRRFGQEFVIPREKLRYGSHVVVLRAYLRDKPDIQGTEYVNFNVEPSELVAAIGSGESFRQVTASEDLLVSGANSYDPDELTAEETIPKRKLVYDWNCELSTAGGLSFSQLTSCPAEIMKLLNNSSPSFTVPKVLLQKVSSSHSKTYLRFSLRVRKDFKEMGWRSSLPCRQVVEISQRDKPAGEITKIATYELNGRRILLTRVKYYQSIILSPSGPNDTHWRYRLVEPSRESYSFLKNPRNLVPFRGFYELNGAFAGRKPLGITANSLKPDTKYTFEIEFEGHGQRMPSVTSIGLQTVPKPSVDLLAVSPTEGTTKALFTAFAIMKGDIRDLKFYFYVELLNSTSVCIDGCSGNRVVNFRIPIPGTYKIRCGVVDALGGETLAWSQNDVIVKVHNHAASGLTKSSFHLSFEDSKVREHYETGDHAAFSLASSSLIDKGLQRHLFSGTSPGNVEDIEAVRSSIRRMASLYHRTSVNTPLGRDYALLASKFSSVPIGNEILADTDSFMDVVKMLAFAINNTPDNEAYENMKEIRKTLENLGSHARQQASGGTTRRMLLVDGSLTSRTSEGVNLRLLELSEIASFALMKVIARSQGCGFTKSVAIQGLVVIHVSVLCNEEQGTKIQGQYSNMTWCKNVFARSGDERMLFVVAEHTDYVAASGVLSLRGKHVNNGYELDTTNMASHSYVLTKTMFGRVNDPETYTQDYSLNGDDNSMAWEAHGKCFGVELTARDTRGLFEDHAEVGCLEVSAIEYRNTKRFNKSLVRNAYSETAIIASKRSTNGIESLVDTSVHVSLSRPTGQTLGVKRFHCVDYQPRIEGIWRWTLGVIVGVLMGVFAATLVSLCMTCCMLLSKRSGPADEDTSQYFERDMFGRGLEDDILAAPQLQENNTRIINYGTSLLGENRVSSLALDEDIAGAGEDSDDEEEVFSSARISTRHSTLNLNTPNAGNARTNSSADVSISDTGQGQAHT